MLKDAIEALEYRDYACARARVHSSIRHVEHDRLRLRMFFDRIHVNHVLREAERSGASMDQYAESLPAVIKIIVACVARALTMVCRQ